MRVVLATPADRTLLARLGFRAAGPQMIRVDMAERIAARAHEAQVGRSGAGHLARASRPRRVARLMRDIGFAAGEGEAGWVWRGRGRRRRTRPEKPGSAHFAALAGLRRG